MGDNSDRYFKHYDELYKIVSLEEYETRIWESFPITDININALGLCGESGEFANKLKKRLYKQVPDSELADELGDVLWHVAQCARLIGSNLQELMKLSLHKTESRYNRGHTPII